MTWDDLLNPSNSSDPTKKSVLVRNAICGISLPLWHGVDCGLGHIMTSL